MLNVLERMDQDDSVSKEPLSIPKTHKHENESQREYLFLSYDEFIAGRRQRNGIQSAHNSLAGSDVSLVHGFLNRIVGLAANGSDEEDDDSNVPGSAFDMRDETDNAEGALAAGEEFDTAKTRRREEEHAKEEHRRAAARKATKEQIVSAVNAFRKRISQRKESGAIDNQDILRLRALLMIICTAACPPSSGKANRPKSRLQVLPLEGDQDSWPLLLGRTLFEVFGGNHPAIRNLYLTNEHDQIPDDIVECWATCYWCLHACATAPISSREHKRVSQYFRPLAELACRLTLPTKEELLGDDVASVMNAMSENYGARLGVDATAIVDGYRTTIESIFGNSTGEKSRTTVIG